MLFTAVMRFCLLPCISVCSLLCQSVNYCDKPTCPADTAQMSGTLHPLVGNSTGEVQLRASVRRSMAAMARFGPISNPSIDTFLHLSFQYLCCYNKTELAGIAKAIQGVKWAPISVTFTRIVCAGSEFVALASPTSQGQLFAVVSAFEEAMARAGFPVHRFRASQFAFHASLFKPPYGHQYPNNTYAEMLAAANAAVRGGIMNTERIVVDSFVGFGQVIHAAVQ